jgi:hypothetical protein
VRLNAPPTGLTLLSPASRSQPQGGPIEENLSWETWISAWAAKTAVLRGNAGSHAGEPGQRELCVTGKIVGLAGSAHTGTILSEDGLRLTFSAAGVLGDFDALTVGSRVNFDVDRAGLHQTATRVFREPSGTNGAGKKPGSQIDLRYAGFDQAANIRSYRFDAFACGHPVRRFIITVDLTLMLKHHICVQEAPALCLRKLAADLKALPDSGRHELDDGDLRVYVSSQASVGVRKKPRHSFAGRRGSPPPGPSNPVRAS